MNLASSPRLVYELRAIFLLLTLSSITGMYPASTSMSTRDEAFGSLSRPMTKQFVVDDTTNTNIVCGRGEISDVRYASNWQDAVEFDEGEECGRGERESDEGQERHGGRRVVVRIFKPLSDSKYLRLCAYTRNCRRISFRLGCERPLKQCT